MHLCVGCIIAQYLTNNKCLGKAPSPSSPNIEAPTKLLELCAQGVGAEEGELMGSPQHSLFEARWALLGPGRDGPAQSWSCGSLSRTKIDLYSSATANVSQGAITEVCGGQEEVSRMEREAARQKAASHKGCRDVSSI